MHTKPFLTRVGSHLSYMHTLTSFSFLAPLVQINSRHNTHFVQTPLLHTHTPYTPPTAVGRRHAPPQALLRRARPPLATTRPPTARTLPSHGCARRPLLLPVRERFAACVCLCVLVCVCLCVCVCCRGRCKLLRGWWFISVHTASSCCFIVTDTHPSSSCFFPPPSRVTDTYSSSTRFFPLLHAHRWFVTLFANLDTLPLPACLRVWDTFLAEGCVLHACGSSSEGRERLCVYLSLYVYVGVCQPVKPPCLRVWDTFLAEGCVCVRIYVMCVYVLGRGKAVCVCKGCE